MSETTLIEICASFRASRGDDDFWLALARTYEHEASREDTEATIRRRLPPAVIIPPWLMTHHSALWGGGFGTDRLAD
jgi:hypothetical protein